MPQQATQDTDATLIGNAHIPIAEINPYMPTIAKAFTGPPTLGPILETGQRRALLGWTHKKDTPEDLLMGRLWCWVGERKGNFQVRTISLIFVQLVHEGDAGVRLRLI
jgi:hypothetical protein